jgi:hypothetical protein
MELLCLGCLGMAGGEIVWVCEGEALCSQGKMTSRACVGCWFRGLCGNGAASGAGEMMESGSLEENESHRGERGGRLGRDGILGLGLGFIVFFFFKIAPLPFVCVVKLLFIGKNIVRSPNLVPQLFFFLNLIFLIFFGFFLSTLTRMRKIGDFKNNTLKVKCILKTFENLNSFETMLKTMQIY